MCDGDGVHNLFKCLKKKKKIIRLTLVKLLYGILITKQLIKHHKLKTVLDHENNLLFSWLDYLWDNIMRMLI